MINGNFKKDLNTFSYDELKSQNLTVEQLYEITNCFSKIEKTVKFRRNK